MKSERWAEVQALFEEALALPTGEWPAFLEERCPDDPTLRDEVLSLLTADARAQPLLDRPLAEALGPAGTDPTDAASPLRLEPGTRIGPWRVQEVLGEGGMGVVYRAERAEGGFDQEVALKLVKRGMDTAQIVRRFEEERRILAALDHPNIARLLDGGVSDDGSPYFVMEYVRGRPIDEYCDDERLSLEQRLDVFVTVCRAVLHAHSALVVHRDLKPANILVTDDGVPKLLDFGIAKLLEGDEESTSLTQLGGRVLTPGYASPEQFRGDRIGTASDIYSLGVILYELLVGERPSGAPGSGAEPPRPSTAPSLTRDNDSARTAGEARRVSPEKLRRKLAGDLDVICLKALRPEPDRRYASADALAEDLERHLRGLPVQARPDTLGYRLNRFVTRNKAVVSASAMGVALLLAVSAFYTAQLARERDIARVEAERAREVSDFLVGLFETEESEVRARDLLDRGEARLRDDLAGQPELLAQLREVIGEAYYNLGEDRQALALLEESVAALDPGPDASDEERIDHLDRTSLVAKVLTRIGELDRAEGLYRAILEERTRLLAPPHIDLAEGHMYVASILTRVARYEEAVEHYDESVRQLRELGRLGDPQPNPLAQTLSRRSTALLDLNEDERALRDLREVDSIFIELNGERHVSRIDPLLGLAWATDRREDAWQEYMDEAEGLIRELHPEGSFEWIDDLGSLADQYSAKARRRRATELYLETAAAADEHLGSDHRFVDESYAGLAELLVRLRRYDEALPHAQTALDVVRRRVGDRHNLTARYTARLGQIHIFLQDFEASARYLADAASVRRELGSPFLASDLEGLGSSYRQLGRLDEALAALEESAELYPRETDRARIEVRLARLHMQMGRPDRAAELAEGALAVLEPALGDEHPVVQIGRQVLEDAR